MRKLAFLAPLGAVLAVAATPVMAEPDSISVTVGPGLLQKADALGERDVRDQAARLADVVRRTLARNSGDLDGARIDLVLTDLRPNRPTYEQMAQRPGLDGFRSVSIGGAAIEGHITTADGRVLPVKYDWYTDNISEVRGFTTWQDADRAYQRLADNLARGRYVSR